MRLAEFLAARRAERNTGLNRIGLHLTMDTPIGDSIPSPAIILVEHANHGPIGHRMRDSQFSDETPPCWPRERAETLFPTPAHHYHGPMCEECWQK